jgi:hypothetical protein
MRPWWALSCVSLLAGCFSSDLVVLSPSNGDEITDHEPIAFRVELVGADVDHFEIEVDGVPSSAHLEVSPEPRESDCDDCTYDLVWPSREARQGTNRITVIAFDRDDTAVASGDVELSFDDVPEVIMMMPDGDDLRGVGMVNLDFEVLERGAMTARLVIDGSAAGEPQTYDDCRFGCDIMRPWETAALAAGPHVVELTLEDDAGHQTEVTRTLQLDDIVRVTAIEVTNEGDFSLLDMEVHMIDSDNQFVACAGNPGLEDVDASDVHYEVDAPFMAAGLPVGSIEVGARAVRFAVWEDDNNPCPVAAGSGDDPLGASPLHTLEEWKAQPQPMAFGTTTALAIEVGRPYTR